MGFIITKILLFLLLPPASILRSCSWGFCSCGPIASWAAC